MRKTFFSSLVFILYSLWFTPAVYAADHADVVLGDYAAEPRIPGRHVDVDRLVHQLSEVGANTYMWLIWHSPNDWEDLKIFLPKAQAAGINVWVYLVPPSETPEYNEKFPYSEPFRTDYPRWAAEIAKLSLQYGNLKGYVMDDFWNNVVPNQGIGWLRKPWAIDSVRAMVSAGKAVNPRILFYPLMYLLPNKNQIIDPRFSGEWTGIIDGIVAADPQNSAVVEQAQSYLKAHGITLPMIVMIPGSEQSAKTFHRGTTPSDIAAQVKAMKELARKGIVEGVVTYCLDKSEGSKVFDAVKNVYKAND